MSCGLTANCDDLLRHSPPIEIHPFIPDDADNAGSIPMTGFLQAVPPDFDREELQDIRDRARQLSIQGSPAKTMEERLYQQLADIADQLDAISARFEAEVKEITTLSGGIPINNCLPATGCGRGGCCGNPIRNQAPFIGIIQDD